MRKELFSMCQHILENGPNGDFLEIKPEDEVSVRLVGAPIHYFLHVDQAFFRVGNPQIVGWNASSIPSAPIGYNIFNNSSNAINAFDNIHRVNPVLHRFRIAVLDVKDQLKYIDIGFDLYKEFCEFWKSTGRLPGGSLRPEWIIKTSYCSGSCQTCVLEEVKCLDFDTLPLDEEIFSTLAHKILAVTQPHSQDEVATLWKNAKQGSVVWIDPKGYYVLTTPGDSDCEFPMGVPGLQEPKSQPAPEAPEVDLDEDPLSSPSTNHLSGIAEIRDVINTIAIQSNGNKYAIRCDHGDIEKCTNLAMWEMEKCQKSNLFIGSEQIVVLTTMPSVSGLFGLAATEEDPVYACNLHLALLLLPKETYLLKPIKHQS